MALITIRPATTADLPQIRDIMDHYVHRSRLTFLQNTASQSMFNAKFMDITSSRGLPYLVAVEREADAGEETVIGHTYLSPFRGHMLSYGPTVELSLFVHPDRQSRSIGSRLLDALLERAKSPGIIHHAREVLVHDDGREETFYSADRAEVRVRNILAVMAVDADGKDGGEALRRWYISRGFVERGRMDRVGFKMGRW
jgi:L-amino acid N-acyltransferase YncA